MNHFCWLNCSYIYQHYLCRRPSCRCRKALHRCRPLNDSRQLTSPVTAVVALRQTRPDHDPSCKENTWFFNKFDQSNIPSSIFCEPSRVTGVARIYTSNHETRGRNTHWTGHRSFPGWTHDQGLKWSSPWLLYKSHSTNNYIVVLTEWSTAKNLPHTITIKPTMWHFYNLTLVYVKEKRWCGVLIIEC